MKKIYVLIIGLVISLSSFATTYLVQTGTGATWTGVTGTVVDLTVAAKTLDVWHNAAGLTATDQVWIAAGTYNLSGAIVCVTGEKIFGGFAGTETAPSLRGRGSNFWDFQTHATILDGGANASGERGITTVSTNVIDGLTIQNCKSYTATAPAGAGIKLTGGSTSGLVSTVRNCIVQNCVATGATNAAGGISCATASSNARIARSYIYNCSITSSTANDASAGGVALNGTTTMDSCTVDHCTSSKTGGGVVIRSGGCSLLNSSITYNTSTNGASGGVHITTSSSTAITITNCIIDHNINLKSFGGGINSGYGSGSTPVLNITGTTISNNVCRDVTNGYGGALNLSSGTNTLTNCKIFGDSAAVAGSAIAAKTFTSLTAKNCLIYGNQGAPSVVDIAAAKYGTFQNCTFASNYSTSPTTYVGFNLNTPTTTSSVFTNCLFYNSSTTPLANPGTAKVPTVTYSGFESTVSPAFPTGSPSYNIASIDANTFNAIDGSDWSLKAGSTAIDAGNPIAGIATDITGAARNQGFGVDMGAYETVGAVLTVSAAYLYFDNTTGNTTKTFTVSGSNLNGNIILSSSSPKVGLDNTILTPNAGTVLPTTITAIYDASDYVPGGTITVADGVLTRTITFDAIRSNEIGNWDGNAATGIGTEPTVYGWGYTGTTITWGIVQASNTTRLADGTAMTYLGNAYTNREFITRWDANTGSDLTKNFYLPVTLTAGKQYVFGEKTYQSSGLTGAIVTYSINSASNNSGTSYGSVANALNSTNYTLTTGTFNFSVPTDGIYYLTVTSNKTNAIPTLDLYIQDLNPSVAGAPIIGTATASNAQALVTFTAPVSNGAAITGYTVTSSPGNITATGIASPITVTGLTNGTDYTFTVTATNALGTGAASVASNSVTPMPTVPGAPTNVTVDGGGYVSFTAPISNGGSAITAYTVNTYEAGAFVASATPTLTIPVLGAGIYTNHTYTFTVTATNAVGTSIESAPSAPFTAIITSLNSLVSMLPVSQVGSIITVNLAGLTGNQTVTVFDVQGKNLVSATAKGGNTVTINKSLNNGMYLVKVQGAEKTFITKLMIR